MNIDINTNDDDLCIVDSATTHTILKSNKFFSCLVMREVIVSTISGTTNIIEGSGRTIVLLPRGTRLDIKNSFYSPKSNTNLLSFNDIRLNGCHIEYLYITPIESNKKCVLEKLSAFAYGLYYTYIKAIETHVNVN